MFTEEFKKACEGCQSEEELQTVIDSHKSELTDEELQQVAGGAARFFNDGPENPFDLKRGGVFLWGNSVARQIETHEAVLE